MGITGGFYWMVLPVMQSLIIPRATGGSSGPWVIRPILAFRFGAAAVLTCVTLPVVMWTLQRVWRREDGSSGPEANPLRGRSIGRGLLLLKGLILTLLYALGLIFYLSSWTRVGPAGIEQRLPWGVLEHPFSAIASLETIPAGWRSDVLVQNGPWYSIRLRSGRVVTLSTDNEGTTRVELVQIAEFISQRSGVEWEIRGDAHRR